MQEKSSWWIWWQRESGPCDRWEAALIHFLNQIKQNQSATQLLFSCCVKQCLYRPSCRKQEQRLTLCAGGQSAVSALWGHSLPNLWKRHTHMLGLGYCSTCNCFNSKATWLNIRCLCLCLRLCRVLPAQRVLFFPCSFFGQPSLRRSAEGNPRQPLTCGPVWWSSGLSTQRCPYLWPCQVPWSSGKEQSDRTGVMATGFYKWQHLSTDNGDTTLRKADRRVLKRETVPTRDAEKEKWLTT